MATFLRRSTLTLSTAHSYVPKARHTSTFLRYGIQLRF